jgi:hypothetical protein
MSIFDALKRYDILVSSASSARGKIANGVFRFDALTGRFEGVFGGREEIRDPRGIRSFPASAGRRPRP